MNTMNQHEKLDLTDLSSLGLSELGANELEAVNGGNAATAVGGGLVWAGAAVATVGLLATAPVSLPVLAGVAVIGFIAGAVTSQ
jgi:hypothetical protein